MKLNCKPGDLAVIVGADSLKENIGGLVEVIEWVVGRSEPTWRVKTLQKLRRRDGFFVEAGSYGKCRDSRLRPLRDNDGEDETLQWVPRKVEA